MYLGFDLDGTLLASPWNADYRDPSVVARFAAIQAAVARLRALLCQGAQVLIVTGRTRALQLVTERQVEDLLGQQVPIVFRTERGKAGLVAFKAEALRANHVRLYVGDTIHDAHAAYLAGVLFMPAQAFAGGLPPPLPWRTLLAGPSCATRSRIP
jgi:phosphoglycolate phosphatase-like HAD superfamily hydrolase